LAGMFLFIFKHKNRLEPLFKFLMGFSFLFIGLELMKESEVQQEPVDHPSSSGWPGS